MPLIKSYPNRKLYTTETKQDITLEGIAELIRSGEEISVIDHATGEDLTTLTLTQIIVEQEKKQSGLFPKSLLASLIQSGEDRLGAIQRSFAAQLNSLHQFDEEIRQRIQELVRRGDLSEGEGKNLVEKLLNQTSIIYRDQQFNDEEIEKILKKYQIPTHDDFQKLTDQIDELTSKLDEIIG